MAEALSGSAVSLPFSGANLLLTRTFFSLQRPWIPTALGGGQPAVNAAVSLALYEPFGIAGIVVGTVVSTAATTFALAWWLRRSLSGRLEAGRTASAVGRMVLASAALGWVAYGVHQGLEELLGDALVAQAVAVGAALLAGIAAYAAAVLALRVDEALYLQGLVGARLRGRREG